MKLKLLTAATVSVIALGLGGCVSQPKQQLTPEQQAQQQAFVEAYIAQMKAKTEQLQKNNQNYVPPSEITSSTAVKTAEVSATISDKELRQKLSVLDDKVGASFKRMRDGLLIDNTPFIDPEGEILDFTANNHTGDFTYIVKTGDRTASIKYANAANPLKGVVLASLDYNRGNYTVRSVTGKNLRGQIVLPTSQGFAVSRNGSIFIYSADNDQLTSFNPPEGFNVARFQNGDIARTGYILVERDEPVKGSLEDLMDFGTLGNLVGVSEVSDYMLVNVKTGKSVPLVITTGEKSTGFYSGCVKKSDIINECAQAEFRSSLYDQSGNPNMGHYYWRVSWYNTPEGNFSISMEQGSQRINITNLDTQEKVTLFERSLGINDYVVTQSNTGRLAVKAKIVFSLKEIPDAVDFWKKNKDLVAAKK